MVMLLEMETTASGERVRGWPGFEEWVFDIDVDAQGRGRLGHAERPKRSRRQLKDCDVRRIVRAVEAQRGIGIFDPAAADADELRKRLVAARIPAYTGFGMVDLVIASRPYPRGSHNTAERAETIAMVYGIARSQGLCPNTVLAQVYGFTVDSSGTIAEHNSSLERWVRREARGKGFLADYNDRDHRPERWPSSGRHRLEGSRSPVMQPEATEAPV